MGEFVSRFNASLILGMALLGFTVFMGALYWFSKYMKADQKIKTWPLLLNATGMCCIVGAGLYHGFLSSQLNLTDAVTFRENHLGNAGFFFIVAFFGILYIAHKCTRDFEGNNAPGLTWKNNAYWLMCIGFAMGGAGGFMGAFLRPDFAALFLVMGCLSVLAPLCFKLHGLCMKKR